MSKREFIRNVRRAVGHRIDDDWCGHLYDDVIEQYYATQFRFFKFIFHSSPMIFLNRFILLAMLHRGGVTTKLPDRNTINLLDKEVLICHDHFFLLLINTRTMQVGKLFIDFSSTPMLTASYSCMVIE